VALGDFRWIRWKIQGFLSFQLHELLDDEISPCISRKKRSSAPTNQPSAESDF